MIFTILQILSTIFSAYVFLPMLTNVSLGGVFRFIALAPFGVGTLVLSLIISLIRFVKSCIFRRKIAIILNLILLVFDLIIGLVFIL